jgi:hypothetical protein
MAQMQSYWVVFVLVYGWYKQVRRHTKKTDCRKQTSQKNWTLFVHLKINRIFGQILTKWQQLKT